MDNAFDFVYRGVSFTGKMYLNLRKKSMVKIFELTLLLSNCRKDLNFKTGSKVNEQGKVREEEFLAKY
jgi:hypothetical protein